MTLIHTRSIDFPPENSWRSFLSSLWDLETYVNFMVAFTMGKWNPFPPWESYF